MESLFTCKDDEFIWFDLVCVCMRVCVSVCLSELGTVPLTRYLSIDLLWPHNAVFLSEHSQQMVGMILTMKFPIQVPRLGPKPLDLNKKVNIHSYSGPVSNQTKNLITSFFSSIPKRNVTYKYVQPTRTSGSTFPKDSACGSLPCLLKDGFAVWQMLSAVYFFLLFKPFSLNWVFSRCH